ncbi:hypothetical protein EJ08DRAFT_581287, partial [Tothia fuscella]
VICTESPRKEYIPLSDVKGWYEYYTAISDKVIVKPMATLGMKATSDVPNDRLVVGFLRRGTKIGSMALTIIAGLERTIPDLVCRTTISLHLIGAAEPEIQGLMVFEEVLHLLTSLKTLQIAMVGIDIPTSHANGIAGKAFINLECCPACTSSDRTRSVTLCQGTYHDYIETNRYEKPDLAVAFHSGLSQSSKSDWLPTIKHLAKTQHPTLFTTDNEDEMEEETAIFRHLEAKLLVKGEINKWKSVCPIIEPLEAIEDSVYYQNYLWYLVEAT